MQTRAIFTQKRHGGLHNDESGTISRCIQIMNPVQENGGDKTQPDYDEITRLFLAHNTARYNNFLRRFEPATRKHIRVLPLLFHVNQSLFPGYINNQVPHTIYNYIPDTESVHHARIFNSAFSFDPDAAPSAPSIEAIYIQDNLKSGTILLWVIPHPDIEPDMVALLKEKAHYISKWRESRNINLQCHVALPQDMPVTYWGDKYNSLHLDKSIFLDDFYSESILIAGKTPAWWLIAPDTESSYDQIIENIRNKNTEQFANYIDFGSIASARPQDYLASVILNLINIRQCPEETWLNILDLCHKLTAHPALDCTSLHIKENIYAAQIEQNQYQDIYCKVINETIDTIYGREQAIIIARTLKIIARRHDSSIKSANIYRILLTHRRETDTETATHDKLAYEYTTATEIITDFIKQAFLWFLEKLDHIDGRILPPDSGLRTIANNLIRHIEPRIGFIPLTNNNRVKAYRPYDVCIKHIIEHRNNSWSLIVADSDNQSFEIRQGSNPVELAAWGVPNRLITHETRISVSCPYLSVKQDRKSVV